MAKLCFCSFPTKIPTCSTHSSCLESFFVPGRLGKPGLMTLTHITPPLQYRTTSACNGSTRTSDVASITQNPKMHCTPCNGIFLDENHKKRCLGIIVHSTTHSIADVVSFISKLSDIRVSSGSQTHTRELGNLTKFHLVPKLRVGEPD